MTAKIIPLPKRKPSAVGAARSREAWLAGQKRRAFDCRAKIAAIIDGTPGIVWPYPEQEDGE